MKKLLSLIFAILLAGPALAAPLTTRAKSAFLLDQGTNTEIFAKDADTLMPPSSMIKLMTLALTFDAIKTGKLSMESMLSVPAESDFKNPLWAQASKICLVEGQEISVRDLILGLIVVSGGDAAVVVANALSGSESDFTNDMAKFAKRIGMPQSSFGNSTGLPDPSNLVTSRELATLANFIINEYQEFYPLFATKNFELAEYQSDWCKEWGSLHTTNYNKLLFTMPGAEGMKTGHTDQGGYGMVATASKSGRRLIAVVNGLDVKNHNALANEAQKILEWGFANTFSRVFFTTNDTVIEIPVWYGKKKTVNVVPSKNIAVTLPVDSDISKVQVIARHSDMVSAPVKAGDKIGDALIYNDNRLVGTVPLLAKDSVGKVRFLGKITANLKILFGGK